LERERRKPLWAALCFAHSNGLTEGVKVCQFLLSKCVQFEHLKRILRQAH